MKRGEIWRARFPSGQGHAQGGERPAIIIQGDSYSAVLPTVLVVPLTGSLGSARFPGTLLVQPDAQNGLNVPSVALVFQTRALDKVDLLYRIGELDPATVDQVAALLAALTG